MQYQRTRSAQQAKSIFDQGIVQLSRYATVPIIATLIVWATGTGRATFLQIALAHLLLQFAWGYWIHWKQKPDEKKDFPLFAVIAGMYWLAYGLPVFWGMRGPLTFRNPRPLTEAGVTAALALAVVALASLFVGMHLGIFRRLRRARTLDLRDAAFSPRYLAVVMLLGPFLGNSAMVYVFGSGLRQLMMILRNIVPLVAFAILLRRRLMRPVPTFEGAALIIFVGLTIGLGLASGWIGTGVGVIIIASAALVDTRFKIPVGMLAFAFAFAIFLQPAKGEFRIQYWGVEGQTSETHRAADWITTAVRRWGATFSDTNPATMHDALYSSVDRFSLLQQTAYVMQVTPIVIPYQGGIMYRYMGVTLIPRALWPDKPTVNEANRLYQVTYGLTTVRNLGGVSISVGMAAESYIAYGWVGTICIMTLVGIFLEGLASVCLARNSGVLMKGIGLAILPSLAGIEGQMAQYLGGLAQQILVTIVVMLPIACIRQRRILPDAPNRVLPTATGLRMLRQNLVRSPMVR